MSEPVVVWLLFVELRAIRRTLQVILDWFLLDWKDACLVLYAGSEYMIWLRAVQGTLRPDAHCRWTAEKTEYACSAVGFELFCAMPLLSFVAITQKDANVDWLTAKLFPLLCSELSFQPCARRCQACLEYPSEWPSRPMENPARELQY